MAQSNGDVVMASSTQELDAAHALIQIVQSATNLPSNNASASHPNLPSTSISPPTPLTTISTEVLRALRADRDLQAGQVKTLQQWLDQGERNIVYQGEYAKMQREETKVKKQLEAAKEKIADGAHQRLDTNASATSVQQYQGGMFNRDNRDVPGLPQLRQPHEFPRQQQQQQHQQWLNADFGPSVPYQQFGGSASNPVNLDEEEDGFLAHAGSSHLPANNLPQSYDRRSAKRMRREERERNPSPEHRQEHQQQVKAFVRNEPFLMPKGQQPQRTTGDLRCPRINPPRSQERLLSFEEIRGLCTGPDPHHLQGYRALNPQQAGVSDEIILQRILDRRMQEIEKFMQMNPDGVHIVELMRFHISSLKRTYENLRVRTIRVAEERNAAIKLNDKLVKENGKLKEGAAAEKAKVISDTVTRMEQLVERKVELDLETEVLERDQASKQRQQREGRDCGGRR